jgi:low temperature requirement protein LtrA
MNGRPSLLRDRKSHESGRVAMVELFFDLVFVFAVTQCSHFLLGHLTGAGARELSLMLLAMWWVWIYTSWVTNWLDPERMPVRICLFVLMVVGLLFSVSIPEAFAERGLVFAGAYVFMQVGRTLFFLWAVRGASKSMIRNFQRIAVWFLLSGVAWIAGAFAEPNARFAWWLVALLIEFSAPLVYFWVPGLGRARTQEWDIDGNHLSERCALFVIIALGESLLVTGASFAELRWNETNVVAFMTTVLGSIAIWWIYFDTGAERARYRIAHSSDPGRQARTAYTYMHAFIVGGIIVCAAADELVLMHPDHATDAGITAILGGPALYLAGSALFKWIMNDRRAPPFSHVVALALLGILIWPAYGHMLSALMLGAATTVVLVVVAVWEFIALRRASSGEPVRGDRHATTSADT